MSRSVADVFREAGRIRVAAAERRLAAFIEGLPTDEDRRRFFEAARIFLSFDLKTQQLPPAARRRVLKAPIEEKNIAAELLQATKRLLREHPPGDSDSDFDLQLFGARVLMARLIVELQGASDRQALVNAALQLRELGADAELARSKIGAQSGRRDALADTRDPRKRLCAWLKTEAEKVRKESPNLRSRRDRATALKKRLEKRGENPWPTPDALIAFANRNDIKI